MFLTKILTKVLNFPPETGLALYGYSSIPYMIHIQGFKRLLTDKELHYGMS